MFTYADSLMGLPVPPGPESCNSSVLNTKLMRVRLRLKRENNGVVGFLCNRFIFVRNLARSIAAGTLLGFYKRDNF